MIPTWIAIIIIIAATLAALGVLWTKALKPATLGMLRRLGQHMELAAAEAKATADANALNAQMLPPPGGPMLHAEVPMSHGVQDDRQGRRLKRMTGLFLVLMITGFMVTVIHDYAYRRADVTGTGDYEFGGWVSHAGTDVLIATFVISAAAILWYRRQDR